MEQRILKVHKKVLAALTKMMRKNGTSCVVVSSLAAATPADSRTVMLHLRFLEIDGCGRLSKDGKMFEWTK